MKQTQKGFSVIETLLLVAVVVLIGALGWLFFNQQILKNGQKNTADALANKESDATTVTKSDLNKGYLVVKEWGLRFKVPDGLTDIRYFIQDDVLSLYAKPKGYNVEYRSDYNNPTDGAEYSLESVIRSNDSSKSKLEQQVSGKKLGDKYYYTRSAFSALATGVAMQPLFFDDACVKEDASKGPLSERCEKLYEPYGVAFVSVKELVNSIELSK